MKLKSDIESQQVAHAESLRNLLSEIEQLRKAVKEFKAVFTVGLDFYVHAYRYRPPFRKFSCSTLLIYW